MIKFIKNMIFVALVLMLCSSVVSAQKMKARPDSPKRKTVSVKHTDKTVVKENAASRGTVIYSEGFEDTPYFELPTGWVRFTDYDPLDPNDAEDYCIWIVINNYVNVSEPDEEEGNIVGVSPYIEAHSGEQQLALSWVATGIHAWAISSGIDLIAGVQYEISFWFEMPGYPPYGEVNSFKATIGQTPTANAMNNAEVIYEVYEEEVYDPDTYESIYITYTFTPTVSGTYYLGFKDESDEEMIGIYTIIDDIQIVQIGEAPEVCDPVTNFTVVYNEGEENCEVVLTWTAPAGADKFNIYRDNVKIAANFTETTYTDNSFDSYLGHTWAVRVVCEEGGESNPVSVTKTACKVGISKLSSKVSIYPNPARDIVYVDGDIVKVEIYNMFGQLIDTQKGKSIDVSKYNAGMYLFKAYDVNNNIVIKNISVTR